MARRLEKIDPTSPAALAVEAVALGLAAWEIRHRLRNRGVKAGDREPMLNPLAEVVDAETTVFVYPGEGEASVGIQEEGKGLSGAMAVRNENGELVPHVELTRDLPRLRRLVSVMRSFKDQLVEEERATEE